MNDERGDIPEKMELSWPETETPATGLRLEFIPPPLPDAVLAPVFPSMLFQWFVAETDLW